MFPCAQSRAYSGHDAGWTAVEDREGIVDRVLEEPPST
ncbi:MAG: hypothetical protein ACJASK_002182, partial [Ilumatobacter sp.]